MGDPRNLTLVEPCDICGSSGFPENIVTCAECKITREHVYCMRVILLYVPQIWICEECRCKIDSDAQPGAEVGKCQKTSVFYCKKELGLTDTLSPAKRFAPMGKPIKQEQAEISMSIKGVEGSNSAAKMSAGVSLDNHFDCKKVGAQQNNLFKRSYPAAEATSCWCGTMEIAHSAFHRERYSGFHAQFPGVVHRKAFQFSKKLPGVLVFTMVPSKTFLEVLENRYPRKECAALYFFPGCFERSKRLLDIMETKDLVLRSQLNGVELFVFHSKWLEEDLKGLKPFLWGVYRPMKNYVAVPSLVSQEQSFEVETKPKLEKKVGKFNISDCPPGFGKKAVVASAVRAS